MTQRRPSIRELLIALAAGLGAVAISYLVPGIAGLVAQVEYRTVDWRFHVRGTRPSAAGIVIVAIDEQSLAAVGRWPWPRRTVARLLDAVEGAGPTAVAFDVLFAEPSDRADDAALEQAIARWGNVCLPAFISSSPPPQWLGELPALRPWQRLAAGQPARAGVFYASGLDVPLRRFAAAAAGVGVADLVGSGDGVYRDVPLVLRCGEALVPSLPLAVACVAAGVSPASIQFVAGRRLVFRGRSFPVDVYGLTPVDFAGPSGTFVWVSAAAVLDGDEAAISELSGKIVLIGATAPGLFDLRPSPFDPQFRGVEALANVVDNLLSGRRLQPTSPGAAIALCLLLVVAVAAQVGLMPPHFGWLSALAVVAAYFGLATHAFVARGMILPMVVPLGASLAAAVAGLIARLASLERQRRHAVEMFSRFVPPEIAERLADEDLEAAERGHRRVVTVMFADIRDSTTYARRLDPEEFVDALNRFFEEGHSVVWKYGGTLDKFIGDAILAFFNAPRPQPDHALRAVAAALELVGVIKRHADTWEFHGLPGLRVGVGIATGEAVVGYVGSRHRMQYTVMGPTVHLAARLEELAKRLGADVLITDETFRHLAGRIEARDLGAHAVHGFEEPVRVWEVLSIKNPDEVGT